MRDIGLRPLAGLIHHGSGPAYTSLLAKSFVPGLARHARAVAERYPWVEDWTPVNEPLTTARFSALYGFWYPHRRDYSACWHALLNQIDATRLAMREILRVNPAARLIQIEDLGYCDPTTEMAEHAALENEQRRWLTWDLLCGLVQPTHPLWSRLVADGFEDRLRAIGDDPCPPDVIGINYYWASERLVDHRLARYPGVRPAADSMVPCVDVDAVRTVAGDLLGAEALIRQAWDRYRRTNAITECHNGSLSRTESVLARHVQETDEQPVHHGPVPRDLRVARPVRSRFVSPPPIRPAFRRACRFLPSPCGLRAGNPMCVELGYGRASASAYLAAHRTGQ